jgi:uncharacterized RmlC-like cupin family protein
MIIMTQGNEAPTVRHQIGIASGFTIGNTVRLRRNPQAAETVGSERICMNVLPMPSGARAKVHYHDKIETIAYLLEGRCAVYYGDQMEHRTLLDTGDQIFIPADVPHAPCNESWAPCTWIGVHSSASDQDGIALLQELDRVLEERSLTA